MSPFFWQPVPKSNSSTLAITKAKQEINNSPIQAIPPSIQDRHGRNKKYREQDEGYLYSHNYPENISGQSYLEKPLKLYTPKNSGAESAILERIQKWMKLKEK